MAPQLEIGNMWKMYKWTDLFLITTNCTIVNDKLVMGAGIAYQAKLIYEDLPTWAAEQIRMRENPMRYGMILPSKKLAWHIGLFQVKDHWQQPAKLDLIRLSTVMLHAHAMRHPNIRIDLNMPGVGFGRLQKADVWPIIEFLPSNVHVWEFDPGRGKPAV